MYLKTISLVIGLMINPLSCFALFLEDTVTIENTLICETDEEFTLSANVVNGDGVLIAKNIFIDCYKFEFTGTIRCDGLCRINARSRLDSKMFTREGQGTFEIITNFDGESHLYRNTERSRFQPWLLAVLDDISLTQEQKKDFLAWAAQEVLDHFDKADPLCEQANEAGIKAREKFIHKFIELMISGLKKVGVLSPEKVSMARVKFNEVVRKKISEKAC